MPCKSPPAAQFARRAEVYATRRVLRTRRAAYYVIIEKRNATALRFSNQSFLGLQMMR